MLTPFHETQKFSTATVIIPIAFSLLIPLFGLYQQIIVGKPFGNNPLSNMGLLCLLLFLVVLCYFMYTLKLNTYIDEEGIYVQYFPLLKKFFSWQDIEYAEIIDYGFVGGWGLRRTRNFGMVYNTAGKMGLAIRLKNGKKYCIGTQNEKELAITLESFKPKSDELQLNTLKKEAVRIQSKKNE